MLPSLHRSTLDYCFLLYLIFQCIQATQEEQLSTGIIHLDAYHFIGKADSSKNSTHQLDSSLFNNTLTSSFFIEMELTVEGSIFEAVQIVFGLNNKNALKLDSNSSLLVADYIDVGGFYLRKKYFHLSIPIEYLQNNNTYLTIYQNQLISQVISYELLIGSENEGDNHDKKRCPFDCLGNGVCDYSLGTCNCRKGYFDFDCSRLALSLDHFKSQNINDTFVFNWNSTLTPKTRNTFYYLPIASSMDNSLILKIHSIAEKQTADLLVVFSTQQHQNGSAIIPQATYSLSPSQLKNEVYLQLLLKNPSSRELQIIQDSVGHSRMISQINIKRSLELSQNIQGQLTNFSYYLIGFMQIDGNSIEDYSVTLQPKKNEIQSETDTFFNIHGSTLIICLFAVLVLLVCLLLCLLICLYRRNGIINQILKEINLKKNEKSEEMKTILALMPETIYNDNFKLALQHGDAEEPACSVCLCEFEKDDILRQTYCPHAFHSDCLQSWLLKQKNCPHCRNPLSSAAIKGRVKSPQRNKHKLPLFSFNQPKQDLQQQGYGKEVGFIRQIDETTNEVNNSPLFDNQKNFEKQVSIPVEKKETKSSRKFQVNQQELPNDFTNVLNQNQIEQNTPKNSKLFQDILPIELNNNNNMQAGTLITDVHSISLGEDSCKRNFRNRSSILSNGESLMKDSISQFSCKSSRNNHTRFKSYAPRKDSLTEE